MTLAAVGACTIHATQPGNTNYAAASAVNRNFQVTRGSQTIVFGMLSNQTFGAAPITVSATSNSGLTVSLFANDEGVQGRRNYRDNSRRRHLHDPSDAVRQHQLDCRDAGEPELPSHPRESDHHLRDAIESGIRHRPVYDQRDRFLGLGRELLFGYGGGVHGLGATVTLVAVGMYDPCDTARQRQLRRGYRRQLELSSYARQPDY